MTPLDGVYNTSLATLHYSPAMSIMLQPRREITCLLSQKSKYRLCLWFVQNDNKTTADERETMQQRPPFVYDDVKLSIYNWYNATASLNFKWDKTNDINITYQQKVMEKF